MKKILYCMDLDSGLVLKDLGVFLVTDFTSCVKLAEEQERGVRPLLAVEECGLGLSGSCRLSTTFMLGMQS